MRKFLALAAVVLGLASCQTEPEGLDVNVGGEQTVIVNVTVPEAETRAAGTDSAAGAFANGVLGTENDNTTMRYILQVYLKNGEEWVCSDDRKVAYSDGKSVAFEVRLVPDRDYQFVVWADVVTDGKNDTDNHYITKDANGKSTLGNITLKGDWNAMDESRDAFTATELIEDYSGSSTINITLKRPFAKLRVVTTDMEALNDLGITPAYAVASYTTTHYASFNAFNGTYTGEISNKTHEYEIASYGETDDADRTLFTDYFFAKNEVVKFNFDVYEDNAKANLIKSNSFQTDINVKANYLTTIKGNILTDGKGFTVTVEDGFENIDNNGNNTDPDYDVNVITSGVELLKAINASGNYVLGNSITVTEADVLIASTLAATRSTTSVTTINLNGFTITIANGSAEPLVTLEEGEKIVFEGDGAIVEDTNNNGDFIDNTATDSEVVFAGADYDEEVFTEDVTDYANDFINAFNNDTGYTLPADIIVKQSLTLPEGKSFELDLNGKTISAINSISDKNNDGKLTSADNVVFIDVRGTLTVKNGTMTLKHTGDNYGWNACTELFYVGYNGTLNVVDATIENLGGSDMAYCIDMVNATNTTVNVNNSTLKSTYIPFRVFNNGSGMNNVTINNSTLEGVSRAFWVHIYSNVDNGGKGVKSATLNLDIYGNGNTFIASDPNRIIEFGFDDEINFNAEGEQIVYSAARLKSIANYANSGYSFKGETIKLAADIDLNNENWTAIGTPEANFCGTFDGCDYTIKNLKILVSEAKEGKAYVGLFGYAKDAIIKNVIFENVDINVACLDIDHSQGHIGAVAGSLEGTSTIENVTVKGDVKVYATQDANGASRVAVVAGGNAYGNVTMKNVHVIANEGSYLIANNNTGALAGQLQGKSVFENCSSNIDVTVNKFFAGGIIGLAAGDQTFTNCHTTGNIAVVAGREGRAHDQYRVGGIAGGWSDGKNNVCTLVNCSYTGNVSGKNSDGSVANPLDYMGYVGRGYTLNGCQGSTVNIDGVRYVQKYNTADQAGIYDVYDVDGNLIVADGVVMNTEGEYLISKAAGLTWFSDQMNNKKNTFAGKKIKVVNDIDMAGVTYYGGSIASYPSYSFKGTFDGGEKVISNLTITVENDVHGAAALIPTLAGDGTTIKNVILKNVNISSSHYAAGIWGYTTSDNCWINVTNCHVEGGTITGNICNGDNADKVGGIGGIFYTGTVSGCSVKDVTISGYRDTAGIVGWAANSNATIKNNSIENVTINVNNATNYKKYTKRSEYDVNDYVGEGVGTAKLEGNTGEATINWGSIAE